MVDSNYLNILKAGLRGSGPMHISRPVYRELSTLGLKAYRSIFTFMELVDAGDDEDGIEIETELAIIYLTFQQDQYHFQMDLFAQSSETRFISLSDHSITFMGWTVPESTLNTCKEKKLGSIFDLPSQLSDLEDSIINGVKTAESIKFLIDVPRVCLDVTSTHTIIESLRYDYPL